MAALASVVSYVDISRWLTNQPDLNRLLLIRRGDAVRARGRNVVDHNAPQARDQEQSPSLVLNTPEADNRLELVFRHRRRRARLFGASALAGHGFGLVVVLLMGRKSFLIQVLPIVFLCYSFWVFERFSHFGGLIALRHVDPLWFWPRIWKECGVLITVAGIFAAVFGLSALFIWLVSR